MLWRLRRLKTFSTVASICAEHQPALLPPHTDSSSSTLNVSLCLSSASLTDEMLVFIVWLAPHLFVFLSFRQWLTLPACWLADLSLDLADCQSSSVCESQSNRSVPTIFRIFLEATDLAFSLDVGGGKPGLSIWRKNMVLSVHIIFLLLVVYHAAILFSRIHIFV